MSVVFNIGYEKTDIVSFIATLKTVGIECLVDVRAVPQSRKKGFSKKALATAVQEAGLKYIHFEELGDPKEGRIAARNGAIKEFVQVYEYHLSKPSAQHAMKELARLIDKETCCLMCFERDHTACHRSIICIKLEEFGITSFQLYGDNPTRYERHRSKLPRRNTSEGAT